MTLHEMAPYQGDIHPRLQAYQRWLYDGLAGDPWEKIAGDLDTGFERGFSEYKPS
ncbi:hypothetical protein ACFQYP_42950 [Nonomuraea antimicrobica]